MFNTIFLFGFYLFNQVLQCLLFLWCCRWWRRRRRWFRL